MHKTQIFPSLISADLLNLETVIKTLEPYCDGFHIDIMDNHFVPNLTWGSQLTNEIAHIATKPLLVHLMIENPGVMIGKLKLTPQSVISFHLEATDTPQAVIDEIKKAGYTPSIAIKPGTPLSCLFPFLENNVHHVLLMSVEPGFSGQKFMESATLRLKELVAFKTKTKKKFIICMDGGITRAIIGTLSHNGAQQFAVASALFNTSDPIDALKKLYDCAG